MLNENSFKEELEVLEQKGLRRRVPDVGDRINLSSNDYLGLSHHPKVIKAAEEALKTFPVGGTSSRLLAGTFSLHRQLEEQLAAFLGKEQALLFSSGYHANTGILPALLNSNDIIFMDRLCHASLIDGVRLSSARFCTFDHNNVDHLESLLRQKRPQHQRAVIVTEGIFSMDGDFGILPEIVYLAKLWDALIYLDEAHSFGVLGPDGRGLAAELDLLKDVDIFVGTLSKTLASQGGFVACKKEIADLLISKCRSFIFTTALAPVCVAAAQAALSLFPEMSKNRENLRNEAAQIRLELQNLGYDTLSSQSQIIPVWTGDVQTTKSLSEYLFSEGFFVPSIRPPTVPVGQGRVRLSIIHDGVKAGRNELINSFSSYSERPRRPSQILVKTN